MPLLDGGCDKYDDGIEGSVGCRSKPMVCWERTTPSSALPSIGKVGWRLTWETRAPALIAFASRIFIFSISFSRVFFVFTATILLTRPSIFLCRYPDNPLSAVGM